MLPRLSVVKIFPVPTFLQAGAFVGASAVLLPRLIVAAENITAAVPVATRTSLGKQLFSLARQHISCLSAMTLLVISVRLFSAAL